MPLLYDALTCAVMCGCTAMLCSMLVYDSLTTTTQKSVLGYLSEALAVCILIGTTCLCFGCSLILLLFSFIEHSTRKPVAVNVQNPQRVPSTNSASRRQLKKQRQPSYSWANEQMQQRSLRFATLPPQPELIQYNQDTFYKKLDSELCHKREDIIGRQVSAEGRDYPDFERAKYETHNHNTYYLTSLPKIFTEEYVGDVLDSDFVMFARTEEDREWFGAAYINIQCEDARRLIDEVSVVRVRRDANNGDREVQIPRAIPISSVYEFAQNQLDAGWSKVYIAKSLRRIMSEEELDREIERYQMAYA